MASDPAIEESETALPSVWIAALEAASGRRLWGMNLVERQVRQASLAGLSRCCIWSTPETRAEVEAFRADFAQLYQIAVDFVEVESAAGLYQALARSAADILLLEGSVVYDDRIVPHLIAGGPGSAVRGEEDAVALYLTREQAACLGRAGSEQPARLASLVAEQAEALELAFVAPSQIEAYVAELRLTMEPHMLRPAASGSLRPIERLMYRRTFKGVIDVVASHGYYDLVRWITRHISKTRISPNALTVLSIAGIWVAVPCFAAGAFGWGVLAAWIGVLLDSVDGKLARLRLHLSDTMGHIEHLSAMPGLGLWFIAWGWHLSGGQLLATQGVALATWLMVGAFLVDKALSGAFRAHMGRELFDYTRLDALVHPYAARRNIALVVFTAGWAVDAPLGAFWLLTGWMLVTLVFHLVRAGWLVARGRTST